jgi:hypothetical protein
MLPAQFRSAHPTRTIGICYKNGSLPNWMHHRLSLPVSVRLANWQSGNGWRNYSTGESGAMGSDGEGKPVFYGYRYKLPLRWVGFADEVCKAINHTGWYLDGELPESSDTARGVVYRLPNRNGPQPEGGGTFLAGYMDQLGEMVTLALETFDDAEDAAREADSLAEAMADREKEYRAEESRKDRLASARSEASESMREARRLEREADEVESSGHLDAAKSLRSAAKSERRNYEKRKGEVEKLSA